MPGAPQATRAVSRRAECHEPLLLGRPWERAQAKLNHLCSSNDAGEVPGNLARSRGSWRPLHRQDGEASKSPMENSTCQLTAAKARNHSWAAQWWTDWEPVKRSLPTRPHQGRTDSVHLVAPIQTNRAADPGVALGGQALSQHAQRMAAKSGGANAATSSARDFTNATGNESLVGVESVVPPLEHCCRTSWQNRGPYGTLSLIGSRRHQL